MPFTEKKPVDKQAVFRFLDALHASGQANMLGAAEYIAIEFVPIHSHVACDLAWEWLAAHPDIKEREFDRMRREIYQLRAVVRELAANCLTLMEVCRYCGQAPPQHLPRCPVARAHELLEPPDFDAFDAIKASIDP